MTNYVCMYVYIECMYVYIEGGLYISRSKWEVDLLGWIGMASRIPNQL